MCVRSGATPARLRTSHRERNALPMSRNVVLTSGVTSEHPKQLQYAVQELLRIRAHSQLRQVTATPICPDGTLILTTAPVPCNANPSSIRELKEIRTISSQGQHANVNANVGPSTDTRKNIHDLAKLNKRKLPGECKSPCGSGQMLMTPLNEPRLCSPTLPCPQSHWCHVGITPELTVCCSTMPNTCEMPLMKGHGNSYLTRWHFDSTQKKCVKFIYSGEGGNQ
ncbi:Kunitz/Bovine pancreatic trypsin inhibitor domain protein, partial [Ancylostoma caninum]